MYITETENERIKFQYFKLNFFIKFEKFIKFLENIYIISNDSYITLKIYIYIISDA